MCDPEEFNMYLANLEEFVFDEGKIVSISWLSRTLDIHIALSKKILSTFIDDENFKSKLSTCWFLLGTGKTNPLSKKMLIVPSNQLESAKEKFDKITSEHIYSIQKKGNSETDINIVYLADQCAEKNMAQCSSLSNIKCDQVKVVASRKNFVASETYKSISKQIPCEKTASKSGDSTKKSPVKNTLGNMFSKKNEEVEKKQTNTGNCVIKEFQKANDETEKSKKGLAHKKTAKTVQEEEEVPKKNSESPAKKISAGAGKKKGSEKGAGTKNITSFFSKGPLPPIKKNEPFAKKPSTKTNKESKKEIEEEPMAVDEIDENKKPAEEVENVEKNPKEKYIEESNSKSKKTSTKSKTNSIKAEKKEKEAQKRRRIQVFSDSSESEQEEPERDRSLSPPPLSPPRVDIKASLSDDDDDVIPPTPEPQSNVDRKRKRKLVTKTMTDESGFLRTVKEFETVSCSDSDGESSSVKQNAKKPKVEEAKAKGPPVQQPAVTNQKSPTKSKQTSILNFFKKSS